jgi:glycerol kinase
LDCLPTIVNSFEHVGEITLDSLKGVSLCCILGDQQSSAYAHNLGSTEMKITYGTGCFLLSNIGNQPIFDESFVTTILHQSSGERAYGF